jgi:hypothetical protein
MADAATIGGLGGDRDSAHDRAHQGLHREAGSSHRGIALSNQSGNRRQPRCASPVHHGTECSSRQRAEYFKRLFWYAYLGR